MESGYVEDLDMDRWFENQNWHRNDFASCTSVCRGLGWMKSGSEGMNVHTRPHVGMGPHSLWCGGIDLGTPCRSPLLKPLVWCASLYHTSGFKIKMSKWCVCREKFLTSLPIVNGRKYTRSIIIKFAFFLNLTVCPGCLFMWRDHAVAAAITQQWTKWGHVRVVVPEARWVGLQVHQRVHDGNDIVGRFWDEHSTVHAP